MRFTLILSSLLWAGISMAQETIPTDSTKHNRIENWQSRFHLPNGGYMDLNMYIQWWNVVTLDYAGIDEQVRYDMFVRRGRLGTSGRILPKLFFNASFAYDGVGKDSLSAAAGVPNAEDNSTFFPRDVFVTYSVSNLLNITTGYFRPRVIKESFNSSSFVISQEKSLASFHPRIHLVGRGIGRETGVNIGGVRNGKGVGFIYDVGIFDCNHPAVVGTGSIWSPLLTGRFVLMLGDPEMTEYSLAYMQSGYGQRRGLSLGANMSDMAKTEIFDRNRVYGVDAQLNFGPVDLLLEYDWLYRTKQAIEGGFTTTDRVFTSKLGYNFLQPNGRILQPALMYSYITADNNMDINPYTGAITQFIWEAGVNYRLNRDRLKLGLFYYAGKQQQYGKNGNFSYVNMSLQMMM